MLPQPLFLATDTRFNWIRKGVAQLALRGNNLVIRFYDGTERTFTSGPGGGLLQWGAIAGTIAAQQDLTDELDLKFNKTGGAITGNVSISLVLQTQGLLVSDTVVFAATNFEYNGGPTGASAIAHRAALGIAEPVVGIRQHAAVDDELGATDRYVRSTGNSPVIQRVPNDAVLEFPLGTRITVRQCGTGVVTLTPGVGVTLNGQKTTAGQHRSLGLIKVGPNEWDTERGAL